MGTKRVPGKKAVAWGLGVVIVGGAAWWLLQGRMLPQNTGSPNDPVIVSSPSASGAKPDKPGTRGRRSGGDKGAQPVSVMAVHQQDIRIVVEAIGSLQASNKAVVRSQVSGVLQSIPFKEGQPVRAGQLLARVDPRAFEASVAQAQGTLARDQAQLANARVDAKRYRSLLQEGAVARQQVDTQEALVRQLAGAVQADQAAVKAARLQLSYTQITAPISGRAGLKQVDVGNVVQVSDANGIVSITQNQPMALTFAVPAMHVPVLVQRLRQGDKVVVRLRERGSAAVLATGQVQTLDNAIDASTDTIKVKALFANTDEALFPNQAVGVSLELSSVPQAISVPQAGVLRGAQGAYVYVVQADQTVIPKMIQPGPIDGDWMAVQGEVRPGDWVVIDGLDRLREGAKVEVIAPETSKKKITP
jgi:membrane fusion protein, multidrug efflux system